jgi:hypothetical protein
VPEAFAEIVSSYGHWIAVMLDGLASGSRWLALLPLLFVLSGFALMLWTALKQDWQVALLTAVVLLQIPPVLHLTWMLNRFTPLQGGRYVTAYAYLLVFCLALLLLLRPTRKVVIGLAGLLFWCYFILALQMAQPFRMRSPLTSVSSIAL